MNYEDLYVYPTGRTSRSAFTGALIVVVLAAAFYYFVARAGLNGQWVLTTLLFPAFMLHARRLHDMGQTAWLLLAPLALDVAALGWHYAQALKFSASGPPAALSWAAVAVSAAFVAWGLVGKGQGEANRFGAAAASA